jgi:hypothetical protein
MSTSITPVPNTPVSSTLAALIAGDPLACEILRFLLANVNAMDSAKGIAAWWVRKDELAVQPALHRLFACGAVVAHTLCSGTTVYRLTADPDVRMWLRQALGVADCPGAFIQQPAERTAPADAGDA